MQENIFEKVSYESNGKWENFSYANILVLVAVGLRV